MNTCTVCNFRLWTPVANLSVSKVGLYDDARYPGRCLVVLNQHYEHLDEVPSEIAFSFLSDIRLVSKTLRLLPEVERINQAVLGNQEPHVHAHVIPRRPGEQNIGKAPWDSAPAKTNLTTAELTRLCDFLKQELTKK